MSELWLTGAGVAIRNLRGDRPIGAVAKQMKITTSTLSLIERNQRRLSIDNIVLFANIIGMNPMEVFNVCLKQALPTFDKVSKTLVAEILQCIKL